MKRELPSVTSKLWSASATLSILTLWQLSVSLGLVEGFMLPSLIQVAGVFIREFPSFMGNAGIILAEARLGLALGIATGFGAAVLMDRFDKTYRAFYPIIILTQTMLAVAIIPLLVLRFGCEMTPKAILIVITIFFPIAVRMLNGFGAADLDAVNLLKAMGAGRFQVFRYIKLPRAVGQFFSSLRISTSYAVVGTAISEWLSSFGGLDIYMIRIRKILSFDKMLAVIFLVSTASLILIWVVELLQKKRAPWENSRKHRQSGKTISGVYKKRD